MLSRSLGLIVLLAISISAAAATLPHSSDIFVSAFFDSSIDRFYGPLSAIQGPRPSPGRTNATFGTNVARRPWGIAFGPDANLYVANFGGGTEAITRVQGPFSPTAGAVTTFSNEGAYFDVAFGPDGNLYACGRGPVVRFDFITGENLGEFTHGYPLAEVHAIEFGDDGYLYVASWESSSKSEIVRFDSVTGDFVDVYHTDKSGAVFWDIAFGPGDSLFIASANPSGDGTILRFDRPCGRIRSVHGIPGSLVFIKRAGLNPAAIKFGPDQNLYVSNSDSSGSGGNVLRFDANTGAFIDVFLPSVPGGPRGIAFAPGVN